MVPPTPTKLLSRLLVAFIKQQVKNTLGDEITNIMEYI